LYEIVGVLLFALAQACNTGFDTLAFNIVSENMPDVLSASFQRLRPAAQRMLALLISEAFPHC